MSAISDRAAHVRAHGYQPGADPHAPVRSGWARLAETFGVVLSPAVVALVLRLRLMAPIDLPDPAMHTTYIVDPRDVFTRYTTAYASNAGLREGARVGFLVPARLAYLAFGSVNGFFALRYLLALVAVVPVYLLLRRLYGPPAGVAGILVVLSSPVLVTAWGTDYPDSAVVSYAAGAIACLAMPCLPRWRRAWLAAAGVLLIAAVWSHGVAVPLVAATLAAYLGVRLARDRAGLAGDLALLAGVAVAVTGLLIVASAVLLGHGNFIATTWQAYRFLSQSAQVAMWHSASWRWAPYLAYLLVPPAVLGAFAVTVAGRYRALPTPVLLVAVIAAVQFVAYVLVQFFGTIETLEQHYFSSTLWPGILLVFAITIAELARPLADRPLARWLPPAVLLAVPIAYEADPHVPAFGWAPAGIIVAVLVIAAAAAARGAGRLRRAVVRPTAIGLALTAFAGAALVLTVAPVPAHPQLPGTVVGDPPPAYATALGGSATTYIDTYRISAELPVFVGPATYKGEQLLIWWPISQRGFPNREFAGMYHGMFDTLQSNLPDLTRQDRKALQSRRPGELLLFDQTAAPFAAALHSLQAFHFQPTLMRSATLRAGSVVLHVWLIRIGRYWRRPVGAA
jgi:hypothetical protein